MPRLFVFNDVFVERNLQKAFEGSGEGAPLYVLGEKNIELERKISACSSNYTNALTSQASAQESLHQSEDSYRAILSSVKREVIESLEAHDSREFNTTKYTTARVKKLFANAEADRGLLSASELAAARVDSSLELSELGANIELLLPPELEPLLLLAERIRDFDVLGKPLASLAGHGSVAEWARQGLQHHKDGDSCSFCDNAVTSARLDELRRHFDATYHRLQVQLEAFERSLRDFAKQTTVSIENARCLIRSSPSLRTLLLDGEPRLAMFEASTMKTMEHFQCLLQARRDAVFTRPRWEEPDAPHREVWKDLRLAVDKSNADLEEQRHNLAQTRKGGALRVMAHIRAAHQTRHDEALRTQGIAAEALATILPAVNSYETQLRTLQAKRTRELDGQTLAAVLTERLAHYFGHQQLSIEFAREGSSDGYRFLRNGQRASGLSEGERHGIALLYFLCSLEQDAVRDTISDSTVVIDDPVTSMDQDAMVLAFAFLRDYLQPHKGKRACAQLIVFTHNFELFRIWKSALNSKRDNDRTKTRAKACELRTLPHRKTSLLQLTIKATGRSPDVCRTPTIREVPNALVRADSEHYYLFEFLCRTLLPEGEFLLPLAGNVARRVLEAFARFKLPNTTQYTSAIETLADTAGQAVTPDVRVRVAKVLHMRSHRTEPNILRGQRVSTANADVAAALKFMRAVDPAHYQGMLEATGHQESKLGLEG
jgi:hypothetical protein